MSVLTTADKQSETWVRIKALLTQRLFDLRVENDGLMTQERQHYLVGRIAEVKLLLKLDEADPDVTQ